MQGFWADLGMVAGSNPEIGHNMHRNTNRDLGLGP